MIKMAGLDPDRDLLRVTLQKDNLGLSRKPIYYLREVSGYLLDISHLVGEQDDPEAALLAIVRQFNEVDQVVKKTGTQGLYTHLSDNWPRSLQSREKVTRVANALLEDGRLTVDPKTQGLVAVIG